MLSLTLLPVLLSFGSSTPVAGYSGAIACTVNVNYTEYLAEDGGFGYEYYANFTVLVQFNSINDYFVYSNAVDLTVYEKTLEGIETIRAHYLGYVDQVIGLNTEYLMQSNYLDNTNDIDVYLQMPSYDYTFEFTGYSMEFSDDLDYFQYDAEILWYNFYNSVPSLIASYYNDNGGSYQNGYDQGYQDGQIAGTEQGEQAGYTKGFADGYHEGAEQDETAVVIFTGILNVALLPVNVFLQILNFEVFGINIAGLVSAFLTIAIIVIIVRIVTGKKSGE